MTPNDLELETGNIIEEEYEPDVIRKRVRALLAGLPTDDETVGAVLHEARQQAIARHHEFQMLDRDIERVVAVMDAVIEPAIAWLEVNGLGDDARRHVFGKREWVSCITK
jgi:hypothetical protein